MPPFTSAFVISAPTSVKDLNYLPTSEVELGKTREDLLAYLNSTQMFCVYARKDLSVGSVLLTKDLLDKLLTALCGARGYLLSPDSVTYLWPRSHIPSINPLTGQGEDCDLLMDVGGSPNGALPTSWRSLVIFQSW